MALMEMAEILPGLGSQPQSIPVAGKLDRTGIAGQQKPLLPGAGERTDAG